MGPLDIIKQIQKNKPEIDEFCFASFPEKTLMQTDFELTPGDEQIVSAALEIRQRYKLPFWDSVMLSSFNNPKVSDDLLKRALLHNKNERHFFTSNLAEIERMIDDNPEQNISLSSVVRLKDKSLKHLAILDFHIFPSDSNLEVVAKVLHALNLCGYVLNSGQSYHFIGTRLLDETELPIFLAEALLFSPIIDRAWIAHQIIEKSCSVRVGSKKGCFPVFVREIKKDDSI